MISKTKFKAFMALMFLTSGVFAQDSFQIEHRFFQGSQVVHLSENRGGVVVVLEDNTIHLMNKQLESTELTNAFGSDILEDITSIQAINENTFLLGTLSQSLFLYENGIVVNIKALNPDLPTKINSIDFLSNSSPTVMVGTGDELYTSNDLRSFSRRDYLFANNTVVYANRRGFLLDDYDACGLDPNFGVSYHYRSDAIVAYPLLENENTFVGNSLHDVTFLRRGFGSGSFNHYALYASDNGVYAQHVNDCQGFIFEHITNNPAYEYEIVGPENGAQKLLVATEQGLMFLRKGNSYWPISDPEYVEVPGIGSSYQVAFSHYHNRIFVGTSEGLLAVSDSELGETSFELDTSEKDTVTFCQGEKAVLQTEISSQIDFQWHLNGEPVDGAYANRLETDVEGLYSIEYEFDNEIQQVDVTLLQKFDPLPFSSTDTTLQVGDTLWVPLTENGPFYVNSIFQYSEAKQSYFITSAFNRSFRAELSYIYEFDPSCIQRYNFDITFEGVILSSTLTKSTSEFKGHLMDQQLRLLGPVSSINEIECYSINGQKISHFREPLSRDEMQLSFETRLKGLYLLKIRFEHSSVESLKFLAN